jgi:DNA-binding response OmpR family regulator
MMARILLLPPRGTEREPSEWPPALAESLDKPMGSVVPRILVVDDAANQARVTAIGLRIEGFDVETAGDADGALGLLSSRPFDLAVVDLMMPGTNGIQLARILRERHPTIRVVLTSAYHLSERQLIRADCGAIGFVPKPFDLTDLAQFLRSKLSTTDAPGPFGMRGAAA